MKHDIVQAIKSAIFRNPNIPNIPYTAKVEFLIDGHGSNTGSAFICDGNNEANGLNKVINVKLLAPIIEGVIMNSRQEYLFGAIRFKYDVNFLNCYAAAGFDFNYGNTSGYRSHVSNLSYNNYKYRVKLGNIRRNSETPIKTKDGGTLPPSKDGKHFYTPKELKGSIILAFISALDRPELLSRVRGLTTPNYSSITFRINKEDKKIGHGKVVVTNSPTNSPSKSIESKTKDQGTFGR